MKDQDLILRHTHAVLGDLIERYKSGMITVQEFLSECAMLEFVLNRESGESNTNPVVLEHEEIEAFRMVLKRLLGE